MNERNLSDNLLWVYFTNYQFKYITSANLRFAEKKIRRELWALSKRLSDSTTSGKGVFKVEIYCSFFNDVNI